MNVEVSLYRVARERTPLPELSLRLKCREMRRPAEALPEFSTVPEVHRYYFSMLPAAILSGNPFGDVETFIEN